MKDHYNEIAAKYKELYFDDLSDAPIVDKFISMLPRGAHILDGGCGVGTWSKYLRDKGFRVTGIDISDKMIEMAREEVSDVDFRVMDLRALNLEQRYDGILMMYSLTHVLSNEIAWVLSGVNRVLADEGLVLIAAQEGKEDMEFDEILAPGRKLKLNYFNKDRLIGVIKESGFKVEDFSRQKSWDNEGTSEHTLYVIGRKVASS